jgi:hypothetical protein
MNVWQKIREDGSTGFLAVAAGIAAAVRGGRDVPEILRLRWRLRDTRAALSAAYADLGTYLASRLTAGGTVEPTDPRALSDCERIDALLAEERRLVDDLSRVAER